MFLFSSTSFCRLRSGTGTVTRCVEAVLVTLEACTVQMESKWRQSGVGSVRVSYGCYKQSPPTERLKTILAHPVTLLDVRSVRWVSLS